MKSRPLISFITPMKEQDFRVIKLLESIKKQNYPKNKIEIIIIDGGSNPEVLKECKNYGVKIYNNPRKLAEGAGNGKDQGIWKSKGEYIVIAESDLELIGKNWINDMLKPFEEDKEIFASVPQLYINPEDSITNRYLSYVGVDPFAIFRSLEGQIHINKNLKRIKKEGYYILEMDTNRPFCMGSNGFMFKKRLTKEVGDYAQDIEFIARLAKKGYKKFAFVESSKIWHKNVSGFNDFLKKRIRWTRKYSQVYINEKKDFNWIDNKPFFFLYTMKNLLILPNIPLSIKKTIQNKDIAWLLHAPLLFLSTIINIYYTLRSKKMFAQLLKN